MSLLAPRDNRIQKTDTEPYPNLFDDLIVGGDLTLSSIPQASKSNALYYDTLTKKVSFELAGGGAGNLNEYLVASNTITKNIPLSSDTVLDFTTVHSSVGWTSTADTFTWIGGATRVFEISFIGYVKLNGLGSATERMYNVITLNGSSIANSGGLCLVAGGPSAFAQNTLVSTCWVSINNGQSIQVRATCQGTIALDFDTPAFTATGGRVYNASSYTLVIKELA